MNGITGENNGNRGAITVFLAIIFISLIFFAGIIIDIARIIAAEVKVQQALNSSARSVLAGYDRELAGDYGIFALNTGESAKEELYRYLRVNLKEYHEGMRLIDIEVDASDIEIQGVESILSNEAFKNQILEYMKYRVPVTATESVIDQLKNLKLDKKTAFAKSEKATRDIAKELRGKVDSLNSKIAGVKEKLADLSAGKLSDLKSELEEALTVNDEIFFSGDQSLLNEYRKSVERTNEAAREGRCVENRSGEFDGLAEDGSDTRAIIDMYHSEVCSTLDDVEPMLEELEDLKSEISKLRNKKDEAEEKLKELEEMEERLKSLIDEEISTLKNKLDGRELEGYSLKDERLELPKVESSRFVEFIKETEEAVKKKLVKQIDKNWLIPMSKFKEIDLTGSEYFNAGNAYDQPQPDMREEEAERRNDVILENMDKLLKVINDAAAGTVEKMYIIEYIMDKYTFLTSKTDRSHHFRKGEIEYILAGADADSGYSKLNNTEYFVIAEVMLQVWAMRFAIDTIDNFIGSSVVFPPQRLALALMEGALESSMDMFNMLNGEAIPICPKSFTTVKLKYSDHLRILLFMKPEEEILRKARQLMQVNIKQTIDGITGQCREDFSLEDYSTMITASVSARVNLFFLPLLQVDKLAPNLFENGRYVVRKRIYVGY